MRVKRVGSGWAFPPFPPSLQPTGLGGGEGCSLGKARGTADPLRELHLCVQKCVVQAGIHLPSERKGCGWSGPCQGAE